MTTSANPYPGARPLEPSDAPLLFGRDRDLERLYDATRAVPIVAVLGPSGVGKSSLIMAGLCGEEFAEQADLIVRRFADWGSYDVNWSPETWYAVAISRTFSPDALDRAPDPVAEAEEFIEWLERRYGSSLVVVFDQFEELLRDNHRLGVQFLDQICAVATAHPRGIGQIISMREEFQGALREAWIRNRFSPSLRQELFVTEIAEDAVAALVTEPLHAAGVDLVGSTFTESVVELWRQGRREASEAVGVPIGLLHLQALLYLTWDEINPSTTHPPLFPPSLAVISRDADGIALEVLDSAEHLFDWALAEFTARALDGAIERAQVRWAGEHGSTELPQATTQASNEIVSLIATMAEFLSSGSYKVVVDTDELAFQVLRQFSELPYGFTPIRDDERAGLPERFGQDREPAERFRPLVLEMARRSRRPRVRAELLGSGSTDSLYQLLLEDFPGLERWEHDADRMVAGRSVHGLTPLASACLLLQRFERALQLLEEAKLLRMVASPKFRMAALIHDGFGEALDRWAKRQRSTPKIAVASPFVESGRQVLYRKPEDPALTEADFDGTAWLGWVGCNIQAKFEGVRFENCDLRSTLFKNCTFDNVVFTDCLTHGMLFIDCTFTRTRFEVSGTEVPGLRGLDELRTLTFGFGCDQGGDPEEPGLHLSGFHGYGLFFDGYDGSWAIERCSIEHVDLRGAVAGSPPRFGRIIDSPALRHLAVAPEWSGRIEVLGERPSDATNDLSTAAQDS